ncbi:host attachment protein [Brevundimonas sp. 2R-24]|uniref:Host attachment protein n=1 Tax=Peiella sedimenti TaxID=3061083 RepID=A0ABT8SJ95_9CAUL|nr:host attachment protein [Caulobacteraceae bacterium XZ-24]
MNLTGNTLIVVADGAHARIFEEKVRGGALTEISERLGDFGHLGPLAKRPRVQVHARMGFGSHTTESESISVREEGRYIQALADRLDEMGAPKAFDEIVLIAPPKALGGLRVALSPALARKVTGSEAAERITDDEEGVRKALRRIRLKAR